MYLIGKKRVGKETLKKCIYSSDYIITSPIKKKTEKTKIDMRLLTSIIQIFFQIKIIKASSEGPPEFSEISAHNSNQEIVIPPNLIKETHLYYITRLSYYICMVRRKKKQNG